MIPALLSVAMDKTQSRSGKCFFKFVIVKTFFYIILGKIQYRLYKQCGILYCFYLLHICRGSILVYKQQSKKIMNLTPFAPYLEDSLNLVGIHAAECASTATKFFEVVRKVNNFFYSIHRCNIDRTFRFKKIFR